MAKRPVICFFTDQNVPDSVGNYLRRRGHKVTRLRSVMPIDSPDPVVAKACLEAGLVLVSWDRDFRNQRFAELSRVSLACAEPDAVKRLKEAITLIEFEWSSAQKRADKRISVFVGKQAIRLGR